MKAILKPQYFGLVGAILALLIAVLAIPAIARAQAEANGTASRPVTFAKDVAPIIQEHCQVCHRSGAMAPMSLVTFEEVRPWAKAIERQVETRSMPPWQLDRTVGIQQYQNDPSLTDEQIDTIVRWVNAGAPLGDPKDMPSPKEWPNDNDWQLAKQFGQPDIVIDSAPYTMPSHGQDVWWKPVSDVPVTEPRWVRAVEIRPSTAAGRRIMHHVLARLQQDEPDLRKALFNGDDADGDGPGMLMEWAIGKNYDIYRPNTGKLLLPGSRIWWELHLHAVGEQITDHAQLAIYLYPKGQTPKYRTYLMAYTANNKLNGQLLLDIPPEHGHRDRKFPRAEAACNIGELPAAHAPARQGHVYGGNPTGRTQGDAQLRQPLHVQLDDQLHLCGRCSPGFACGHRATRHRLARQYGREPE